jgi:hypothetical protein
LSEEAGQQYERSVRGEVPGFAEGALMNITFQFNHLSTTLSRSNKWQWFGHCTAEVDLDPSRTELTIQHIADFDLITTLVARDFDHQPVTLEWREELSAAQADGTADAMEISHWPDFIGITVGLRSQKYEHFCTFLTHHFARSDLVGRINCSFYGFVEPSRPGLRIPTKEEFVKGKPYFVLGDHSFVFFRESTP